MQKKYDRWQLCMDERTLLDGIIYEMNHLFIDHYTGGFF